MYRFLYRLQQFDNSYFSPLSKPCLQFKRFHDSSLEEVKCLLCQNWQFDEIHQNLQLVFGLVQPCLLLSSCRQEFENHLLLSYCPIQQVRSLEDWRGVHNSILPQAHHFHQHQIFLNHLNFSYFSYFHCYFF